jgi:hypothetical protein
VVARTNLASRLVDAPAAADRHDMHTPSPGVLRCGLGVALALLTGCSFHNTATHWHGIVGADGMPVFVKVTTNVGFNLGVVLPLFGKTSIDEMLDVSTQQIANAGSNNVRVIETATENYWYGFPPVTWIVTPVITNVSVEYRPSEKEVEEAIRNDPRMAVLRARKEAEDRPQTPEP